MSCQCRDEGREKNIVGRVRLEFCIHGFLNKHCLTRVCTFLNSVDLKHLPDGYFQKDMANCRFISESVAMVINLLYKDLLKENVGIE